jgi:sortase A
MERHRRYVVTLWVERALFAVAAILLLIVVYVFAEGKLYQRYMQRQFDNAVESNRASANERAPVPAFHVATQPSTAISTTNPQPYLGLLKISRLDMSVMIVQGVDDRALRRGIGHIPGTAVPGGSGNIGIAGHRDTFFRPLEQIRRGDVISVQTLEGTYRYVVDSLQIVDPALVNVLNDSGRPELTLVTCYPFHLIGPAPKRFIVHAALE